MRILVLISLALTASILNSQDYFSDRLFVKLKEEYKTTYVLEKDKSLRILLSPAELVSAKPVSAHPFLNSTYELIFDKNINLDSLILRLNRFPEIEFAEKVPLYKLFFTPNDPLYSTQWNLSKIQADLAWNLSQGCTQVKVAVTDDGFLMTHEDLVNQWHINTGEIAGNGIDDDGNGYIDDWRGWDAANNDNDPSATAPTNSFFTHGTHVAGIIAGQTHNSKGIAAIGYNCKMIPVKIGLSPNSSLTGAFQGLDYAINASGCDVVNMSWGGGGWSATYQTLFNIAQAKGIICVAAAGNSNTSTPMYPASYNHVISVAASASTDARASFSNFGSTIDVTAPGVGIPSCLAGATNAYGNLSGTSMASPLVAGLCALMKCYNPMPADSIEACLKRSCDNINAQNPSFIGQLGAGRINAFQALQYLTKKPKSDFIALDTFQCTGKSVRYAARSFGIPTLSYNWSFPGGSPASSTTANPVVSYTTNGYKTATLITCNSLGCDTITKTNLVNIDTPKASLIGRKYASYNSNQVLITIKFTGNPPYSVTLTDGTNTWTQSNVKANPYFLSIVPKKDTSLISISAFSDSLCVGNRYGVDTIHRTNLGKDTTICVVLKTSNTGAIDGFGFSPTTSTNITWTFTNNENVVANWTAGGVPHFWRNILKFNLASIPANAIINSASLSLYSKPNASHGWTGQPTAGTDNSSSISRITNAWTTSSISTSSWPSITTQNQVILTQSPTNSHSYLNIDIKNLVQDLITTNDFGLFLRHVNTPYYNSLIYYSAEETDTSKHPKLVLCYTIPGGGSSSGGPLCRDSTEINSAQTGWQALQTNGSWGSLTASNYCAGAFTPNASLFPSMTASDCIWGPFTETGNRTAYNSASWTTTSVYSCSFARLKKSFSLPSGSIIDSVRLWMVSDDFIDSVWVNNKLVFKAMNPIQYGQILMLGNEINIGNSISPLNEVIVKSGDAGGCYGTYFRMKVYYSKVCENSTSDCDTTNLNTGKVLHLDFNGNTQDKSGNGNHAANFGATPVAGKGGVVNTAYKFNGTSNYMRVSNNATINSMTQITMCAILKPKGFYNGPCMNNQIISKNNINNSGHYSLVYSPLNDNGACSALQDSNKCNFYSGISSGGCSVSAVYKAPFIKKDSWYCVVTTYDGDTAKNYVNGELRFTCKINLPLGSNSADLFIGKLDNITYPYWLNADLDDIRIYNRTLAPSEVKGYCSACSVSQPPPCDTSRRFTYTQCLNDSIQVVLRPGSQYQWSPIAGLSIDTIRNPKIYLNANRTYLASYQDLRDCQLIDTIEILVKSGAIYTKIEDHLICIGDTIQIEIPIHATNILWSPNLAISSTTAKNPYFFPTANRTYYLEFRDSFGCIQKDTFDIYTKVCCPARAQFTIPEDMLCYGENLTITNRSKGPITSYNWSFGNAIPSSHAGAAPPVLNFPNGGTYSLRLIVTNGSCQDTMEKMITVVQIMPNAGRDTTNCLGAFVTVLGESPISDWSYKWTPTKYLSNPTISDPICSIVNDSVNYILEITDRSSGCKAYDTVVVYTNRKIDSTVQNMRICGGDSVLFNGFQRKTSGNYFYTIKKADGICDSFINLLRLNVLQKQFLNYTPKIHCDFYIDSKGKRYDTSYIEQDTIRSKSLLNCDSIINITPREIFKKIYIEKTVQGCSPFRYNGKTYLTSKAKEDSIRIRGAYSGCDSIIEYINVIVYPKPKAEISPSIPNPVLYKQTVTLTASGGSGYLWLQMGSTNSEIDYKLNQIQPRLFTVRVTDDNNCWDTVSYIVNGELPDTCYYGFPNAFTPNQDGLNDEYIPNMDECTEIKVFAIYDRWGEKVFETNQQKGWNGFYKGKPAPLSVYLYYAELITPWGIKIHKGNFTLIR
jgi:gliding motility-associated-like protein